MTDDEIRAEVAVWRHTTPEERLAVLASRCAAADRILDRAEAEGRTVEQPREPLPEDSIAMLEALRRLSRDERVGVV
ncbi:MAG: hypothetical protein H0T46_19930 [Deltaproteobacteria bacterium]|nr:hypothetical protein [Deltaproteobacteria bacterium]